MKYYETTSFILDFLNPIHNQGYALLIAKWKMENEKKIGELPIHFTDKGTERRCQSGIQRRAKGLQGVTKV